MQATRLTRWTLGLVGLVLVSGVFPLEGLAQRPFFLHDPFYRGETARRAFFDGYALSGEVAYRPASIAPQEDGLPVSGVDPLGLSFRFDYQLADQLDLGAIVDASGGRSGRTLSVSWVMLKYYDYAEGTDLSFRLAVDPASDGLIGFPQMDVAFITTSLLTPAVLNDFALGARRVRMGYEQWVRTEGTPPTEELAAPQAPSSPGPDFDVVFTRVMGWEVHLMNSYRFFLDPGGSNLFLTLLAEGGEYDLFETARSDAGPVPDLDEGRSERALTTDYQSAVVWLRSGIEYSRPSYQINPFVSVPLVQWVSDDEQGLRAPLSAGLRLTIR